MDSRCEDFLKTQPREKIESSFKAAMTIVMVCKFVFAVGVYIALRTYASLHFAELWMLGVYATTLKKLIDLAEPVAKKKIMESIGHEPEDSKE